MSKRTEAAPPGRPRRRGLFPRLSDVRIQSKLGLILLVPILAVVVLAGIELRAAAQTLLGAQQVETAVKLSNKGGILISRLQDERLVAARTMMASGSEKTTLAGEFKKQSDKTDRAVDAYRTQREAADDLPGDLTASLRTIDAQIKSLSKDGRSKVTGSSDATVASVTFRYTVLISQLLDLRDAVSELPGSRDLANELAANAALSTAGEFASQEELTVLRVIDDGSGFDNTTFENFLGTLTSQQSAYDSFYRTANTTQQAKVGDKVNGKTVQASVGLESDLRLAGVDGTVSVTPDEWMKAMARRIDALRTAEHSPTEGLDGYAEAHAKAEVESTQLKVGAEAGAGVFVLIVAILLALLVARAMARSLRRLREGALRVAYEGLPRAVSQLKEIDSVGTLSPDDIANEVADPVQVRGRDEIGQVSEAFNVVHREAVRVAAEQAVLRNSVATMFVNLARRSQLLVDRLIGHLDRLEQGEEDPDRLSQLFQLDHLATRMRRNDENLLVLAGADSSRARREAAPLGDVLRAAQSEVEQYTRIEFGVVDRDVEVEAAAVNDVVHLVAELLDNATSFSSPETAVVVDARRVGDRAIVQIEDRGIGMGEEVLAEVNEQLANPPLVDVAVSRMMGLVVVGRLAHRLGIKVELRPASERGLVADVILGSAVLTSMPRANRGRDGLLAPSQPLALSSGPQGGEPAQPPAPAAPAAPPARQPDGGLPGVPYQPSGRDSLADAATGHEHTNGGTGLPQRAPSAPPGDPRPSDEQAGETIRRSLFEPVRRQPAEPEPAPPADDATEVFGRPRFDEPPAAEHDPDATEVFHRPASYDEPPEPARPAPAEPPRRAPSVADLWGGAAEPAAEGSRQALPRRAAADGAAMTNDRGTSGEGATVKDGPSAGEGVSAANGAALARGGVLPERPAAQRGAAAGQGVEDVTVETPQVPADRSAADAAHTRRPVDSATGAGGIDSSTADHAEESGSGRGEIFPRNVDDTMELPIFREVESAWFRTSPTKPRATPPAAGRAAAAPPATQPAGSGRAARQTTLPTRQPAGPATRTDTSTTSGPEEAPMVARQPAQPAASDGAPAPAEQPAARQPMAPQPSVPPTGGAAARGPEVPSEGRPDIDPWQSAADKGWQVASEVAESAPKETTSSGLPRRRPMEQLVPGSIEQPDRPSRTEGRSPEAVRGLLSAYHRGVQRGRSGGARFTSVSGQRSTGNGAGEEQEA